MTEYCRLCAEIKDLDEIIVSINDEEHSMDQKLRACCQWTAENTEHRLPHSVCSICLDRLDKCWLFSQSVQLAQQRLLDIFEIDADVKPFVLEDNQNVGDFAECLENELPVAIAIELQAPAAETSNFQCQLCYTLFEDDRALRNHSRNQSQNKCEVCSREFCTGAELNLHQIEGCDKSAEIDCKPDIPDLNVSDLNLPHDKIWESNDSTTCKLCDKTFSNKSNLRYHQRNAHDLTELYNCTTCGTRFEFRRQLTAHLRSKHSNNPVSGPSIENNLGAIDEQHKQPNYDKNDSNHSTNRKKKKPLFECEDCGRCFTFKSNLRTHQRIAHSDKLPYTCYECSKGFSYNKELRLHRISTHLQKIKCVFQCWLCHETFNELQLLKEHMITHTSDSTPTEAKFQCRNCKKAFKSHRSYRAHCKYFKQNKCENCSRVFCTMAELNTHRMQECGRLIEIIATDDIPDEMDPNSHESDGEMNNSELICNFCNNVFNNKSSLRYHQRFVHKFKDLYDCNKCGKRFTFKKQMIEHRSTHTGSEKCGYECWMCHETFYHRYLLSRHMHIHTAQTFADGRPKYECRICHSTFENHRLLRAHCKDQIENKCENCSAVFCSALDLAAHRHQGCEKKTNEQFENDATKDGVLEWHSNIIDKTRRQSHQQHFKCEFCDRSFSFKSNLRIHLRTIHALKDLFNCNECDKRFEFKRQLTAHNRLKHFFVNAAERYPCPQCERTFSSVSTLQGHQINMHSDEFQCEFCNMKFQNKSDLFEHRNVHTDQKHKCEYCNQMFWKKSNMLSHQRYAHFNIRRFKCDECGKRYPYKSNLYTHLKSHHPELMNREQNYECWCCHKTFLQRYLLKRHMKYHHIFGIKDKPIASERKFMCELCGKNLTQKAGLIAHMKYLHSNERPLKCQHCGLGFKTKHLLNSHLTIHRDFQYKCTKCDKMFRKKDRLNKHMELHLGTVVKRFVCDFCEKPFRRQLDLKEHRRIHTGERPHTCEHCEANFRTKSSFYAHLRKTHGISLLAVNREKMIQESQQT